MIKTSKATKDSKEKAELEKFTGSRMIPKEKTHQNKVTNEGKLN